MSIPPRRKRAFSALATGFVLALSLSGCASAGETGSVPSASVAATAQATSATPAAPSVSPAIENSPEPVAETSASEPATELVEVDPWNNPDVRMLEPAFEENIAQACGAPSGATSQIVTCMTDARCALSPASAEVLCLADARALGAGSSFDINQWVRKAHIEQREAPSGSQQDAAGMIIAIELADGRMCVGSNAGGAELPDGFNGLWGICDDTQLLWLPGTPEKIDLNAPFLNPKESRLKVAVGENYEPDPTEVEVATVYY